jgi:hypothetical protein
MKSIVLHVFNNLEQRGPADGQRFSALGKLGSHADQDLWEKFFLLWRVPFANIESRSLSGLDCAPAHFRLFSNLPRVR